MSSLEYQKDKYARRKKSGLCLHCNKMRSTESTVFCYEHLLRSRNYQRQYAIDRRAEEALRNEQEAEDRALADLRYTDPKEYVLNQLRPQMRGEV